MTHTEIVNKLIGEISPIGKSEVDRERLENLKQLCEVVSNLIKDISFVANSNKHSHEHSVKEIVKYATNFLEEIKEY